MGDKVFTRYGSYTNHVKWANYTFSCCKFFPDYVRQKLQRLLTHDDDDDDGDDKPIIKLYVVK